MRERLWARVQIKAKPLEGVKVKRGTQWLKPGLIGRVRHFEPPRPEEAFRVAKTSAAAAVLRFY